MFKKGMSGNPKGRPKGTGGGRSQALFMIDALIAKKKNMTAIAGALERDLHKDPVGFFKTIVMPLLPKEGKLAVEGDGIVMWRNLLGQDVTTKEVDGKVVPVISEKSGAALE
jgi:hypothetical protein